ncbi:MAG: sporulation integral membrane protein YtvI [Peptococcaceae bacterium]|nr:sporulation integral membrane protein YtvI [Peptococcaceae bacterium]
MTRLLQLVLLIATLIATIYFTMVYFLPKVIVFASATLGLLMPFIFALLFALLMEPVIKLLMDRLKMSRGYAVSLAMLSIFSLLGFVIVVVALRLADELIKLSLNIPHYLGIISVLIEDSFQRGKILFFSMPTGITNQVNENLTTVMGYITILASDLAGSLVNFAISLPSAVVGIIVTVIATFFLSRDRSAVVDFISEAFPKPWGERFVDVSREIFNAFINYIRAQSFLIMLTTILAIIGFYIIGSQYALTAGFMVGLLDIIPVLGPAAIFIPWAIWAFIVGNVSFAVKLLILYLFLWIVRQMLEARVVAANLGLHPLAVLVVMYIGLKLIGVLGLILGPVMLIAGKAMYKVLK